MQIIIEQVIAYSIVLNDLQIVLLQASFDHKCRMFNLNDKLHHHWTSLLGLGG